MRQFLMAVERWMLDDSSVILAFLKAGLVVGVILGALLWPLSVLWNRQRNAEIEQCVRAGGTWVVVGTRTTLEPMLVGKVTAMVPRQHTDYGCATR